MKRCPYQGKLKYHTALDAITSIHNRGPWWNRMRAYLCPHCGFWHLTTRRERNAA